MAKNKVGNTLVNTTSGLWEYIKKYGGLDQKYYDKDIVTDLKASLKLPARGNFDEQLQKSNISTEDFLEAFFTTIKPFSEMMCDLLAMFEKAGAKKSNKNILISFNFDKKKKPYKFDIEKFKETIEITERTVQNYSQLNVTKDIFWRINDIIRKSSIFYNEDPDKVIKNKSIRQWIETYYQYIWPNFIPSQPLTGIMPFDQKVNKVWRIWKRVVEQGKSYDENRKKLIPEIFNASRGEKQGNSYNLAIWTLAEIDSDNWAGEFIWLFCYRIEKINGLPLDIRKDEVLRLENDLDEILKDIYLDLYDDSILEKKLKDFFSLPIWERRYELYAAWVSSQIVSVFETDDLLYHTKDNILNFSFSGTHIASSNKLNPELQFWTELKTKYKKPRSEKRKSNIQPDYFIAINDVNLPESSILVVECKQYKKASSKNFSDAIQDYAYGRPNATVVLVNYGDASQKILKKVDTILHNRVHLIGNMRPDSNDSKESFKKIVLESIKQYYINNESATFTSPWVSVALPAEIRLTWNQDIKDLDLFLYIFTNDSEQYKICYSSRGDYERKPMALYKEDIQDCSGSEIIDISTWLDGKYHAFVNNFSKEALLSISEATLELSFAQRKIKIKCPNIGDGEWWEVFILDTNTGKLEIVNRIIERNQVESMFSR